MRLIDAFTTTVNSALLTRGNHESDNSFVENTVTSMEKEMKEARLVPYGICFNTPFQSAGMYPCIAFVFQTSDGEIKWCHYSEGVWEDIIVRAFGEEESERIIDRLRGY